MELEITWIRAIRIWWAYFWRAILFLILATTINGILSALLLPLLIKIGLPKEVAPLLIIPPGLLLAVILSTIPMKLILGKDFGEFRLVLIRKSTSEIENCPK